MMMIINDFIKECVTMKLKNVKDCKRFQIDPLILILDSEQDSHALIMPVNPSSYSSLD